MDLLRKPTTLWSIATLILTGVVIGVVVEIIKWEEIPKALVISILVVGFLVSAFLYWYGYIRYRNQKSEVKRNTPDIGYGIQPKSYDKRDVIINNDESLVLTPHQYAIGLSGMTGYPDEPANAYWLCLEVAVHPSNKPIDTLDLLIDYKPIPANDWPGKNVAAFNVYFEVTGWKWKGKNQVELIANKKHSSGRIPIDFNVEPSGRSHRI